MTAAAKPGSRTSHWRLTSGSRSFARLDTRKLDPPKIGASNEYAELQKRLAALGDEFERIKRKFVAGTLNEGDAAREKVRLEDEMHVVEERLLEVMTDEAQANLPRGERLRELWDKREAS